jgi:hypothetical protein
MIDIVESFNASNRILTVYSYGDGAYTVSSTHGTVAGNTITVNDNIKTLTVTVTHGLDTEEMLYTLKTKSKTYTFSNQYRLPRDREHLFLNGLYKKYFQSWSSAGQSDFSTASRIVTPLILGSISAEIDILFQQSLERNISVFPLSEMETVTSSHITTPGIEGIPFVPFTHIIDFTEEEEVEEMLIHGYSNGGETIVGNQNRRETIGGDKNATFSSRLKYSKNNNIPKTASGFINSQDFGNMLSKNREPLRIVHSINNIEFHNSDGLLFSYYTPINISSVVSTMFGDIFVLSQSGNIYYGKTEVDIPLAGELNPSVNNNNVVEMSGEYFTPGETMEIVIDMKHLRSISSNTFIVKVSNGTSESFLSEDGSFAILEQRIKVNERENMQFLIETEETDRFIKVEVFIDYYDVPFIGYSAALLLNLLKINENKYNDIYVKNNRLVAKKIISETPLTTTSVIIRGRYAGSVSYGGEYVSFKI